MRKKILSVIVSGMIVMLVTAMFFADGLTVDTSAACAHSSLGPQYSEATHPHYYYRKCNSCGEKIYTGGHATKKHGTGEWGSGTCKLCGTCTYTAGQTQFDHPHKQISTCVCGNQITMFIQKYTCSACKAKSKTVSGKNDIDAVFTYNDGDLGIGTVIPVPLTVRIAYTNTYNSPKEIFSSYGNYPIEFSSYNSKVACYLVSFPPALDSSIVDTVANKTVEYYNSSGGNMGTQQLLWNPDDDAVSKPGEFYLFAKKPSYTKANAVCNVGAQRKLLQLTTTF